MNLLFTADVFVAPWEGSLGNFLHLFFFFFFNKSLSLKMQSSQAAQCEGEVTTFPWELPKCPHQNQDRLPQRLPEMPCLAFLQLLVKDSLTALPGPPQEVVNEKIMEPTHYLRRNFHLL